VPSRKKEKHPNEEKRKLVPQRLLSVIIQREKKETKKAMACRKLLAAMEEQFHPVL
jgi:hypothetical protein